MRTQATPTAQPLAPPLIEWIDFKWLMAGEGHRVSIERLQDDASYANSCLALASASRSATLRWAAARLVRALAKAPRPLIV